MKAKRNIVLLGVILLVGAFLVFFLRKPDPIAANRFIEPDKLFGVLEANVRGNSVFGVIADIDHARLGAKAGSPMPPSHVLIWSDPALEAAILKHNPVAAVDLPLRILAYENQETGRAAVIYNSFEFVVLASVAVLAVGVLQTLIMRFQPTTLWNLLTMMALIGSGGGLMFRSLRGYDGDKEQKDR